jgi:hypothetical protein
MHNPNIMITMNDVAKPGNMVTMDMPHDEQLTRISDSDRDLVNNWFSFHPADTAEKISAHELIRDGFKSLAFRLLYLLPPSPDRTVAMRKLREGMYAANACLACNTTENYNPKARVF